MNNEQIGKLCSDFRKSLGITQTKVASDLNYTRANICEFEKGKNGNMQILMWYINKGLKIESFVNETGGDDNGKE